MKKETGRSLRKICILAGACLLVAALAAEGETRITQLHHLDRGYENPVGCLQAVGARVTRF